MSKRKATDKADKGSAAPSPSSPELRTKTFELTWEDTEDTGRGATYCQDFEAFGVKWEAKCQLGLPEDLDVPHDTDPEQRKMMLRLSKDRAPASFNWSVTLKPESAEPLAHQITSAEFEFRRHGEERVVRKITQKVPFSNLVIAVPKALVYTFSDEESDDPTELKSFDCFVMLCTLEAKAAPTDALDEPNPET